MSGILAPAQGGMQLAASILLAVYLATGLLLLPREMAFLRGVEQPRRKLFLVQDLLLQLSILLTLIPCMCTQRLQLPAMYTVLAGFIALWAIALWAAISRYSYTYRVLLGQRAELSERLQDIFAKVKQEDKGDR